MNRLFSFSLLLLISWAGLHAQRSFGALYLLSAISILFWSSNSRVSPRTIPLMGSPLLFIGLISCVLYSIAFGFAMLHWGFWRWHENTLDILNSFLLPPLLFTSGVLLGRSRYRLNSRLLFAYTLSSLIFVLAALAHSRTPWWNMAQGFTSSVSPMWGQSAALSVRSIEQNSFYGLLLSIPAVSMLVDSKSRTRTLLSISLLFISILSAHVVVSLDGRLGWLALILALLVFLLRTCLRRLKEIGFKSLFYYVTHISALRCKKINPSILGAVLCAVGFVSFVFSHLSYSGVWRQGLCDERFNMFAAMSRLMLSNIWGGRALVVYYHGCDGSQLSLAGKEGSIQAVHNVFLEVFYSAGLVPFVGIVIFAVLSFAMCARSFLCAPMGLDLSAGLRVSIICSLASQWLFQPLLYSDGITYYISFLMLGIVSSEAVFKLRA